MRYYPAYLRLLFMENGQVVTHEGIDDSEIPPEVFIKYKNTRLFPSIEEAKSGKVKVYEPPVKKLIPVGDPNVVD